MNIKTVFEVDPMPAPRLTHQGRFSERAKRYYKYCDDLKLIAASLKFSVPDRVDVTFFIPIPSGWDRIRKIRHKMTPCNTRKMWFDLDNLVKGFFDALCADDSSVYELRARKFWDDGGRIEVFQIKS